MELSFFLPMIPPTVTAQTHRISARPGKKAAVYDSPAIKDARQKFLAHLIGYAPMRPMAGPVRLTTRWCFPMTETSHNGQYKTTRPDTDNLQKLFKDCMAKAGFFRDDAQVASELIEKFYSTIPGIYVRLEEIDP